MKKLLTLLALVICLGASAQTLVYDTTVVRTPLTVAVKSGAGQRDSLYMPPATTAVNGYMTAVSMTNIANLQTGLTTTNSNVATLQSQVAAINLNPTTNVQSGTTYTIQLSDNNKTILMTNTAAVTVTIPTGLPDGWKCYIIGSGTTTTLTPATGVTRRSASSWQRVTQNNVVTIYSIGGNIVYLLGAVKA